MEVSQSVLTRLHRSETIVKQWGAPIGNQYYRSVMPDFPISLCGNCNKVSSTSISSHTFIHTYNIPLTHWFSLLVQLDTSSQTCDLLALGVGAYGSIKEVAILGSICTAKRIHEVFLDRLEILEQEIRTQFVKDVHPYKGLVLIGLSKFHLVCGTKHHLPSIRLT